MIIVTTPMCEKILELAGINKYKVNKNPDEEKGDLAILLSENKVNMNSLNIKLNTFSQIKDSIVEISKYSKNGKISEDKLESVFADYDIANDWLYKNQDEIKNNNSKINVKVYSKFLKDIVEDLGFNIVESYYDYVIYPDYLENKVKNENVKLVQIPTHNNVSKDPIERAQLRYFILLNIENF